MKLSQSNHWMSIDDSLMVLPYVATSAKTCSLVYVHVWPQILGSD